MPDLLSIRSNDETAMIAVYYADVMLLTLLQRSPVQTTQI